MSAKDVVLASMAAMEAGNMAGYATLMADDLVFSGPVPQPLGKAEFVGLMHAVILGVPDWNFHIHDVEENGDTVDLKVQVTGTHTREMPGLFPGMPAVPATRKTFSVPEEHIRFTLREGNIATIHVDPVPGGGIPGILQQLGISMSAPN